MAVTTDGETATNTSSGGGGGGGDIGEEHKHNYIPDYVMGPGAYIPPESPIYVQSREAEMYHHYQQQQQQQQHHHHHHLQQQQQTPQPYFEQPKPEKGISASTKIVERFTTQNLQHQVYHIKLSYNITAPKFTSLNFSIILCWFVVDKVG